MLSKAAQGENVDARMMELTTLGAQQGTDGRLTWRDIGDETAAIRSGAPAIAALASMAIVSVQGDDARTFLQGQLTNDVFALSPGQAQWQGYCQPQGRLLATFALVCESPSMYWLMIPSSVLDATVKRLKMFVLRAKVQIATTDELAVGGVNARDPSFVRVGNSPVFVQKVPTAQLIPHWTALMKTNEPVAEERWQLALVDAGIALIESGATDKFVPQMVGWDTVGVNFKKGCYPGQEIVARAHYRGAVKRKPVTISGAGDTPAPGAAIVEAGDEIGHLVRASKTDGNAWTALATIHQDHVAPTERKFEHLAQCVVRPRAE